MTWAQIATLIVSIAATVAAGTGVIVLSVNGIHSQVAAYKAEAAADRRAWQASMDAFREKADADRRAWQEKADADRRAWLERADADRRAWQASMDASRDKADRDREAFRAEMQRLAERQAHVEGALSTAAAGQP